MLALVKTLPGPGNLELQDMLIPQYAHDEVLIQVRACGICGSDLKIQEDKHPFTPPVIVGHEFSGEIVEVGDNVSNWEVGDRVVSEQHIGACGHCHQCLTGNSFVCASKRAPGYFSNGAFAEYISVPAWLLHRIPDNISFVHAAFTEPAAVAVHGVLERTGIYPEDKVLVLGSGPIGLAAGKMAKTAGASEVILTGIDRDELVRLPNALQMGIDYAVNVQKTNLDKLVLDITKGEGADVVIELAGAPSSIKQSFKLARRLGRVGIIGQPPVDNIEIPYREALFRALTVIFSYSSKFSSWERALSLFKRGAVQPEEFVTHVLPLQEWEQGFELARSGQAIKVVLEP
jgi:L-iditol 2-dehydrogenase